MFCPKCGGENPDNSIFCGQCGNNLSDVTQKTENGVKTTEASGEESAAVKESSSPVIPVTAPKSAAPAAVPKTGAAKPKKKGKGALIISLVCGGALVLIAFVAILCNMLLSGIKNDDAYVFLSDGKYKLITDIKKDEVIEIASSKSDSEEITDYMVAFSPDGKYFYYLTKYNWETCTGTLCRAEYNKLKKDSSKNDQYIETIATNVLPGFRFLDNGMLLFVNGENSLYVYDGKESTRIARNAYIYDCYNEGEQLVFSTSDPEKYENQYTLYGMNLKDLDNKNKIASNVQNILDASDLDNILYTKYEEDRGTKTLYLAGFDKEPMKVKEEVEIESIKEDKVYFTAPNGEKYRFYDYVEDSYATADAGLTEPDLYDYYTIPVYDYYACYVDPYTGEIFYRGELYTSCSHYLELLYYWLGGHCETMLDVIDDSAVYYSYLGWELTERVQNVTKQFVNEFGHLANEDGYIPLTEPVKEKLKEIARVVSGNEDDWLLLCYEKKQYDMTYDYDAYYAELNKWNEARNRIQIREQLKSDEYEFSLKTLYCYENGKLTTVNESVLNVSGYPGAVVFNTTDCITEKVNINDMYSVFDVSNLFRLSMEKENYIVLADGSICKMSGKAAESIEEISEDYNLYFTEKEVFLNSNDGTLYVAAIKDGAVGNFSILAEESKVIGICNSRLFYVSEPYRSGDNFCYDLYSYSMGKSTKLAGEVMEWVKVYEDNTVLYCTGYRSGHGYEWSFVNGNGESTLLGEDITSVVRVDNNRWLYISDEDLYLYDGKEKSKIESEVEAIWSRNKLEISGEYSLYGYEYWAETYRNSDY